MDAEETAPDTKQRPIYEASETSLPSLSKDSHVRAIIDRPLSPRPDVHALPHELSGTSQMTSITRLAWLPMRRHPVRTSVFLIASITQAASHGLMAWCAGSIARSLAGSPALSSLSQLGLTSPHQIAFVGLAGAAIKGVAAAAATFAQTQIGAEAGDGLRDSLVTSLLAHGLDAPSPTAMALITSRVREAEAGAVDGVLGTLRSVAQIIPIAIGLWLVSPSFSAFALAVVAPFGFGLALIRRRWRAMHSRAMGAADALHEEVDDLIRHADLWRTFGSGKQIQDAIQQLGSHASSARVRSESLRVALSSTNEVLGAAALALVLLATSTLAHGTTQGNVLAFAALFFLAYRPLRDLGDARSAITRGQEALSSLASLTRARTHQTHAPVLSRPVQHAMVPQVLRIEGLCVPHRSPALTVEVPPGQILALRGPTGIGKTTLLRALLGLEPTACGAVIYGTSQIPPGAVGPAFRPFAWVPQDAPVISGTLADNLKLAGCTEADVQDELSVIGASLLRIELADLKIGATGRCLSGGERRWVALARALASRLPVILLDEPTEGLDAASRARVCVALQSLRGHRTLIIVSHHDEVLRVADRVVEITRERDHGRTHAHERAAAFA